MEPETKQLILNQCRFLLVALAADVLLGDPPNLLHPVAAMGRLLALGEGLAPGNSAARLLWGAGWLAGGTGLCAAIGAVVPGQVFVRGAAASTLLAYRGLDRAVAEVQAALEAGDLDAARRLLSWHLVSRPTAELSAEEIAAAAIESLAENLSDSVVAPLLAGLVGGLPGMLVYRFVNTGDAMWGYRDARYEWLGKAVARCDDLLNLVPARLTALLIALATQSVNGRGREAWYVAHRDQGRTTSPNAGWPMAAMAGALDTTLTKRGHYRLGDGARRPDVTLIAAARQIAGRTVMILAVGLGAGALGYARQRIARMIRIRLVN